MSEDENENEEGGGTLLDRIEYIEGMLQNLKLKAVAGGGNDALTASAIIDEHEHISKYLDHMKDAAELKGRDICNELFSFLRDDYDASSSDTFWSQFHDQLKALEGTNVQFRKQCLFRTLSNNGCTILHEVCKLNPPAKVVRTLLHITPVAEEEDFCLLYEKMKQFNHLALTRSGEYPLHLVLTHGGSIDLVRLLVETDNKKVTLKMSKETGNSACHLLISNRIGISKIPSLRFFAILF